MANLISKICICHAFNPCVVFVLRRADITIGNIMYEKATRLHEIPPPCTCICTSVYIFVMYDNKLDL